MTTLDDIIGRSQHESLFSRIKGLQVFWVFTAAVLACLALTLLTDAFALPDDVDADEVKGELEAAEGLPSLIEAADLRGDLHMHSRDSDGRETVAEMAARALTPHPRALVVDGLRLAALRTGHDGVWLRRNSRMRASPSGVLLAAPCSWPSKSATSTFGMPSASSVHGTFGYTVSPVP